MLWINAFFIREVSNEIISKYDYFIAIQCFQIMQHILKVLVVDDSKIKIFDNIRPDRVRSDLLF